MDIPELGVIPSATDAHALDYHGGGLKARLAGEVGLVTRDHSTSILSESFRRRADLHSVRVATTGATCEQEREADGCSS